MHSDSLLNSQYRQVALAPFSQRVHRFTLGKSLYTPRIACQRKSLRGKPREEGGATTRTSTSELSAPQRVPPCTLLTLLTSSAFMGVYAARDRRSFASNITIFKNNQKLHSYRFNLIFLDLYSELVNLSFFRDRILLSVLMCMGVVDKKMSRENRRNGWIRKETEMWFVAENS